MKTKTIIKTLYISILLIGCTKNDSIAPIPPDEDLQTNIEVGYLQTNQGSYSIDENVNLGAFVIKNVSETNVSISKVIARIKKLNDANYLNETELQGKFEIAIGKEYQIESKDILKVSSAIDETVYGIYLKVVFSNNSSKEFYKTFFRAVNDDKTTTYNIANIEYQGLPIFILKNGLSAEYAIQKSAANFVFGISHSWETPLQPVASTPDFLERSINKTIDFYNETIGSSTPVETVIISTGIPSVPYLARAMNALVLPLHYLVGTGTVKEAQSILKYANENGYSAYGSLGYDYSISTTTGVSWIKLLDLPEQYKKFIVDHAVQNVVLCGHTGANDGETVARKVTDNRNRYEEGSLYLMHFSGDLSEGYLNQVISDFKTTSLEPKTRIADWEAGIITEQINAFSNTLKTETNVNITSVTANDGVDLWNMGTYVSLALIHKNRAIFELGGPAIRGISLNPYLIAHPSYESWIRYVPFLYWQGFSAEHQYNNHLSTKIKSAINIYFPDIVFKDLNFWVNSTNNFGGLNQAINMVSFLNSKGLSVQENDFSSNEIWDSSDSINSPSEVRAENLLGGTTPAEYQDWNKQLQYIVPDDLHEISNNFSEIITKTR